MILKKPTAADVVSDRSGVTSHRKLTWLTATTSACEKIDLTAFIAKIRFISRNHLLR